MFKMKCTVNGNPDLLADIFYKLSNIGDDVVKAIVWDKDIGKLFIDGNFTPTNTGLILNAIDNCDNKEIYLHNID